MDQVSRFEDILESISGGFFALDRDFRVIYWNRALEEGTTLKREEVVGQNIFDVFPNAARATHGEKYRLAMESGTYQSFETNYTTALHCCRRLTAPRLPKRRSGRPPGGRLHVVSS